MNEPKTTMHTATKCEHGVEAPNTCQSCEGYAAFKRLVASVIDAERTRMDDATKRLSEFYASLVTPPSRR